MLGKEPQEAKKAKQLDCGQQTLTAGKCTVLGLCCSAVDKATKHRNNDDYNTSTCLNNTRETYLRNTGQHIHTTSTDVQLQLSILDSLIDLPVIL